jgi:hypothetical protein
MVDSKENEAMESGGGETINIKTHFYEFKEYPVFMELISQLPANTSGELSKQERAHEQFLYICDQYQEQPHLVDKFLQEIFERLIDTVKAAMAKPDKDNLINECFKYMHLLTKVYIHYFIF